VNFTFDLDFNDKKMTLNLTNINDSEMQDNFARMNCSTCDLLLTNLKIFSKMFGNPIV